MRTTLRTRKPIVKLTTEDFDAFPIWEYALEEEGIEGRDETWVKPIDRRSVPPKQYSLLVAAHFTTRSGKLIRGFVNVTTASDPVEIDPGVLIGKRLYLVLPTMTRAQAKAKKASWPIEARDCVIRRLRLSEREVFPLRYELDVVISREKESRRGVVH